MRWEVSNNIRLLKNNCEFGKMIFETGLWKHAGFAQFPLELQTRNYNSILLKSDNA
jgi:hypothetical protein